MSARYQVEHLLLETGWASPGWLDVDSSGTIAGTGAGCGDEGREEIFGFVVPGTPNLHSHAHQRGLVGWADQFSGTVAETLWSWRNRMYELVLKLSPDDLEALAAFAYVEMLKCGFTSVGEFHYLHHDPDGRVYAQRTELAGRIIVAARRAGIGLTLLPVLYTSGGIRRSPLPEQRRFIMDLDDYAETVTALRREAAADANGFEVGIAPHSLRAVQTEEVAALLKEIPDGPVHIHVAERTEEVNEVREALGAPPVLWLLDHADLSDRWTLIHATHATVDELSRVARSGAVVGLCPLTEANLGDGRFTLPEYTSHGGRWGVGSDANHLIDLPGELRTLEYGQRLVHRRRDTMLAEGQSSVGAALFAGARAGGAQALAQPVGAFAPGLRADLVVLDAENAALAGQTPETVLDAWIFSTSSPRVVRSVMVAGRWVIVDGRHADEDSILDAFRETMSHLHGERV